MKEEIIYKYLKWEYNKSVSHDEMFGRHVLLNSEFYLAKPSELNDPFDSSIIANKYIESLNGEINMYNDLNETYGLTCFSKRNSCILMWSHYADSHKGYCLGFDISILKKTFKNEENLYIPQIMDVEYNTNYYKYEKELEMTRSKNHCIAFGSLKSLTRKSKCWGYEHEVRFIDKVVNENRKREYPSECLKEVILGLKFKDANIKDIIKHCSKNYPHAKIYKCIEDPDKIGIKVIPIELYYKDITASNYIPSKHSVLAKLG